MPKNYPTTRSPWLVARLCIGIGAHTLPSQLGDAARVGAATAWGIAAVVLEPAAGLGADQAGVHHGGAAPGRGD